MLDFLFSIVRNSVLMSLGIIFLFSVNVFFSKKLSAKWRYYIWIVVILGLIIPFRPKIDLPLPKIEVPVYSVQQEVKQKSNQLPDNTETENEKKSPTNDKTPVFSSEYQENVTESIFEKLNKHINVINVLFVIWFAGAAVTVGINLLRHKKFLKIIKRWSVPVTDESILELKKNLESELGIKHGKIAMNICKLVSSPMLIRIAKPIILLPGSNFDESELKLILKHELIHYKRRDITVKVLLMAATAIHWFNPLMYVMNKEVDNACEISCDDLVVKNEDFTQKRIYGEIIINIAQSKTIKNYTLSTYFYGGKKNMINRIKSIFETSRKSKLITFLSITIILITIILSNTIFYALTEKNQKPVGAVEETDIAGKNSISAVITTQPTASATGNNSQTPWPSETTQPTVTAGNNSQTPWPSETTQPTASATGDNSQAAWPSETTQPTPFETGDNSQAAWPSETTQPTPFETGSNSQTKSPAKSTP